MAELSLEKHAIREELQQYNVQLKPFCDQMAIKFRSIEARLFGLNPVWDYNSTQDLIQQSYDLERLIRSKRDYYCWIPTQRIGDEYENLIGRFTENNIQSRFMNIIWDLEGRNLHFGCTPTIPRSNGNRYTTEYSY